MMPGTQRVNIYEYEVIGQAFVNIAQRESLLTNDILADDRRYSDLSGSSIAVYREGVLFDHGKVRKTGSQTHALTPRVSQLSRLFNGRKPVFEGLPATLFRAGDVVRFYVPRTTGHGPRQSLGAVYEKNIVPNPFRAPAAR